MTRQQTAIVQDEEFGLIVEQEGVRPDLVKQLSLILNYFYGYNLMLARSLEEAASLVAERRDAVAHVVVLSDRPLASATVGRLCGGGQRPMVALLPARLLAEHLDLARATAGFYPIDADAIGLHDGAALRAALGPLFERHGIGGLWERAQHVSFRILEQRVQKRVHNLHTLPTLPEVVLRILAVVNDPDSTAAALEEVLHSDPAIVHKLLQVVNTPAFAGVGQRGEWSLRDSVVRMGRRKVGSLALQVKLINSLMKPEESGFDLRRFWIHSVGTAHIADRLVTHRLVRLDDEAPQVHDYWVAALMHDIGKLVLGFFFWEHFERLAHLSASTDRDFRAAETRLGDIVSHEQLGQLLLLRVGIAEPLVRCVGGHHQPGSLPGLLLALTSLSDNLCKDLGMGTLPGESAHYDAAVLRVLGLTAERVVEVRDALGPAMVQEVMDTVERCTGS